MIATIEGRILATANDSLVVTMGGLGLQVFVPAKTRHDHEIGDMIFLHTSLYLRENLMALYGFENEEEKKYFLLLNEVNGIGPKAAMAVLSTLSVDAIRGAILGEEALVFSRVPGIGKKTAEKIILYLKDKISSEEGLLPGKRSDVNMEVLEALTALGYSVVEAQRAIQAIPRSVEEDVEARLRFTLSQLGK